LIALQLRFDYGRVIDRNASSLRSAAASKAVPTRFRKRVEPSNFRTIAPICTKF
jgi:hypothetical protein